jgi:hypothetical protein
VISGLISSLIWGVIVAAGAVVSGDHAATVGGVLGGAAILVVAIVGALSIRQPHVRKVMTAWILRLVQLTRRLTRPPVGDPDDRIDRALDRLLGARMSLGQWTQAVGLTIVNWLASVGCLVAAILAVGANVPWTKLLLIYCAGAAASSFNLSPGGLGVVEGVLSAGLVAAGLRSDIAFGSVIFRLVSFWLVVLVGWAIYVTLRRARRHGATSALCPATKWRQRRARVSAQQSGLLSYPPWDLQTGGAIERAKATTALSTGTTWEPSNGSTTEIDHEVTVPASSTGSVVRAPALRGMPRHEKVCSDQTDTEADHRLCLRPDSSSASINLRSTVDVSGKAAFGYGHHAGD